MNDEKTVKEPKLNLKATWKVISRKHKSLMAAMVVLLIASAALLIFSFFVMRPQSTVVIVGYGDVYGEIAGLSGGYRRDSWLNLLAFPILALVFGVVHNVIAVRIFQKYGKEAALTFVLATLLLIMGALVTMFRLIGEW